MDVQRLLYVTIFLPCYFEVMLRPLEVVPDDLAWPAVLVVEPDVDVEVWLAPALTAVEGVVDVLVAVVAAVVDVFLLFELTGFTLMHDCIAIATKNAKAIAIILRFISFVFMVVISCICVGV